MPSLAEVQRAFTDALRDPGAAVPDTVTSWNTASPKRRFDVYRNNVYSSLSDVLAGRYGAIEALVGEEYFPALCRVFIDHHPPSSPLLMEYGEAFPAFLESFPPLAEYPYFGDVARIEWAWSCAYHAADADPLDPAALSQFAPEAIAGLRFTLHPSLQMLESVFPAFGIWKANTDKEDTVPFDDTDGAQSTLVVRPAMAVVVAPLPVGACQFLSRIRAGDTLGEAAEAASAIEGFDLAYNLTELLRLGAFTKVEETNS